MTQFPDYDIFDLRNCNQFIRLTDTIHFYQSIAAATADFITDERSFFIRRDKIVIPKKELNEFTTEEMQNIEKYHITVYRGDNASLLRFVDLDFGKYAEFDVESAEGDMEYIYTYDEPTDPENGIRLKFEIYGVRRTASGGEQHSAVSGKTIIINSNFPHE